MKRLTILVCSLAIACGGPESRGRSHESPDRAEAKQAVDSSGVAAALPVVEARSDALVALELGPEDHHLMGSTHPPFPPGYVQREAMMLQNPGGAEFSMIHLVRGATRLFLLDSMTHRDAAGMPHWVTVGGFAVPPFDSLKEHVTTADCFLDNQPDGSIIALGRWSTGRTHVDELVDLRFAARPDVLSRRFKRLPLDRVTCWVDEDRS